MSKNKEHELLNPIAEQVKSSIETSNIAEKNDEITRNISEANIKQIGDQEIPPSNFALKKGNSKKYNKEDKNLIKESSSLKDTDKKSNADKEFKIIEPNKSGSIEKEMEERATKNQIENKEKSAADIGEAQKAPPQDESKKGLDQAMDPKGTEIDSAIIALSKKLKLEVLEGHTIPTGTTIFINAGGLPESKRGIKDGVVYFGTECGYVFCY